MRNWWMGVVAVSVVIGLARLVTAESRPDAQGFVSLFDGKSLDGWEGSPDFWSVKDGCILGQTTAEKPTKGNTFLIWKGGQPGDFELRVMWKLENHNSGIQYRSKQFPAKPGDANQWIVGGYQADMDGTNKYTGICYEERGRGIFCKRGEKITVDKDGKKTVESTGDDKKIVAAIKAGDWNEYVITCKGNHVVQKINGVTTAEFTDNQDDAKAKAPASGIIAFQLHAGPPMKVWFKDVKLKKLD